MTASSQHALSHASRRSLLLCVMHPQHIRKNKNRFYAQLQSVLNKILNQDMLILLGDMNAKVGSDNTDRDGKTRTRRNERKCGNTSWFLLIVLLLEIRSFLTGDATKAPGFLLTKRQKLKLIPLW